MSNESKVEIGVDSFELVAYRFAKLLIDESPLDSVVDDQISLEFIMNSEKLESKQKLSTGKDVFELMVQISVFHSADENKLTPIVSATVIGGFKVKNDEIDLNIEQFHEIADGFTRPLYWLVRQRVSSMLTMTKLKSLPISWDIL